MLSFWPFSAQAQFVCGGSADGSEPQTGAGADATAAGGNTNMACGTNANASGLARPQQAASEWAKLPRMQLERQFAGPLQDTIVQRWRDPADGTICYIYLPITAQHSPPTATGYVQYGANTIGSISCVIEPAAAAKRVPPPPRRE